MAKKTEEKGNLENKITCSASEGCASKEKKYFLNNYCCKGGEGCPELVQKTIHERKKPPYFC